MLIIIYYILMQININKIEAVDKNYNKMKIKKINKYKYKNKTNFYWILKPILNFKIY